MTNAVAPVITIVLSLAIYRVLPHPVVSTGIVLAILSTVLLALEGEETTPPQAATASGLTAAPRV